ncbi:epoxide hydrolase family protein [Pseudonocardia benzenivorans]|uniref:Epoxide hydrolase family protein n=1 Tax=Pseudonocardia benzenivorans TaxID=228005 RepID=A0ABW3VPV6_9PSEU|nr:hydrolase [Pseudonocardia sp. D17]
MSAAVEPFVVAVPDEVLTDLRERLARTRWPADVGNADWRYGANRAYLEELVSYWLAEYDWRAVERRMNEYEHFRTTIDDVPIHFIHERGKGPNPMPLVLTHGWPWSFWDYEQIIRPLTDPAASGGDPADAFDVVVPSLPGFGFSVPLQRTGINFHRTAGLWDVLMRERLGYETYAAQGGDWGQLVTSELGHRYADHLIGIHLSLSLPLDFFEAALPVEEDYAPEERHWYHHSRARMAHATSHIAVQSTDPQNLAYAMHDSPAGLLAWLVDRRRWWSDCGGDVESVFTKEDLITLTMLYWVGESFVTSARFYWEARNDLWKAESTATPVVKAPTGIAVFPQELLVMPTAWMEDYYDLRRLTYMKAGGHFAPAEQPAAIVDDVREFFRPLRSAR